MWMAFAQGFAMLFVVLAMVLLGCYLMRRFSMIRSGGKPGQLIQVLTTHHLSPKEKLVLVRVQDETLLIGVTPGQISRIARMKQDPDKGHPDRSQVHE
jgi:flagellar protein FliO/FliZ